MILGEKYRLRPCAICRGSMWRTILFLTGPTVLLIAFWPQVTKNVQGKEFPANNQYKGHMLYTSAMLMMGL